MDKKLIKEYGEDILSYRIRSRRQKERIKRKDFEKYLLSLHREENELSRQKWNLGWVELVPPVQKGWKRFFVLRQDVARSRHAEFFESILKKINTYEWSYRKDFKTSKKKKGKRIYFVRPQKLLEPEEHHFQKLGFTEAEKQFFYPSWRMEKGSGELYVCYIFTEPWRFILRTRPNIITRMRARDPELDSKIDRMHRFIEHNDYRGTITRLLYGNIPWEREVDDRRNGWNSIRNKPINKILSELQDEKV